MFPLFVYRIPESAKKLNGENNVFLNQKDSTYGKKDVSALPHPPLPPSEGEGKVGENRYIRPRMLGAH